MGLWDGLKEILRQGIVFFFNLTDSYGVAIILLTIAIRLVLLPFTFSQMRATQRMQALQPEINRLQQKYKNEPRKLNEETLKLWQKNKVNPMSGCLPLLIQMPFFVAFFQVLDKFSYLPGKEGFLWLPHLGKMDPLYIIPVLVGATTFWQTKISTPNSNDPTQRSMLIVMPVLLAWMTARFASGLGVYWLATTLFSIVQQYLTPKAPLRKGEAGS